MMNYLHCRDVFGGVDTKNSSIRCPKVCDRAQHENEPSNCAPHMHVTAHIRRCMGRRSLSSISLVPSVQHDIW